MHRMVAVLAALWSGVVLVKTLRTAALHIGNILRFSGLVFRPAVYGPLYFLRLLLQTVLIPLKRVSPYISIVTYRLFSLR
jgi:hypothetical protein